MGPSSASSSSRLSTMTTSLRVTLIFFVLILLLCLLPPSLQKKSTKDEDANSSSTTASKKKKNIRDYTDADLERLYEQWDEGEEELPEDEKPDYLKKPKPIDMSKLDMSNPDNVMKLSKEGKPTMLFVSISGNPTEKESSEITQLWQSQLLNANMEVQRYMIESNRAIFMVKDGINAFDVKNFLIQQDRCVSVSIDQQSWDGKAGKQKPAASSSSSSSSSGADDGGREKTKEKKKTEL